MNRLLFLFVIFFTIFLIQSCATTKKTIMRTDPLIGKIINTETSQPMDFESLMNDIKTYDVIYLSEKHDNPAHHNIQQRVIQRLIDDGLEPSIGFEFFSMEDTPDLLNFIDSGKVTHSKKIEKIIEADLRKKLNWNSQSDQMWGYYYDLLSIAKKEKLNVAGIDLPSTLKRRITRKGIKGITPIEKEQVFSTQLDDDVYKDYMFSIFKAVHCGMGHGKMQAKLYDSWVARNDKMAHSITRMYKYRKGPIVIIVGGGHTEYGLGVIDRVAAIDKTIKQVNVALREISVKPSELTDYILPLELEGFKKVPPADFLWLTQRVSYADPCKEFKKMLQRMKKKSAQ
ncbi:MAG TPA: hypothetical protein ENK36_02990 [Desulfobacterales bacterium]|nr:hypothetical protein [Desulfobacterales bacterium]